MSGVTGDFGKLASLIKALGFFGGPTFTRELNRELGKEAERLVDEGISRGVDPYDQPWPERIQGGKALASFRGTFRARLRGDGFTLTTSKDWANVHHRGKTISAKNGHLIFRVGDRWASKSEVRIPRRQLIPGARGLGNRWREAFRSRIRNLVRQKFGK